MRILPKYVILFIAVTAVSLTSCKDDDEDENETTPVVTALTAKQKIVNRDFYFSGQTMIANNDTLDLFLLFDPCETDDFVRFLNNGTAIDDEGATKCDPDDDQTSTFAWELINNDTQIRTIEDGEVTTTTIKTNNGKTLALELKVTDDWDGDGDLEEGIMSIVYTTR